MPQAIFTRQFRYVDPETGERTVYPATWSGELDDAAHSAATEAGVLAVDAGGLPAGVAPADATPSDAPVNPGVTFAPNARGRKVAATSTDGAEQDATNLDAMTKAELEAAAQHRGVTVPSGATKAEIVALLSA